MISFKEGLDTYNKVSDIIKEYGNRLHSVEDVERFLLYLKDKGITVDRADYDDNDIDLDIGTISMSLTYDLTISPIILMLNCLEKDNDVDMGGWAEYDTRKGIIRFPFM